MTTGLPLPQVVLGYWRQLLEQPIAEITAMIEQTTAALRARILGLRSLAVLAGLSELNPQIARDVRQTALAGRLSCMTGTSRCWR